MLALSKRDASRCRKIPETIEDDSQHNHKIKVSLDKKHSTTNETKVTFTENEGRFFTFAKYFECLSSSTTLLLDDTTYDSHRTSKESK